MPIFEYRCGHCGRVFEALVRRPEREATPACPGCGKGEAERLLSPISPRAAGGLGCGGPFARFR